MVPFLPVRGTDICPDNALIPWTWVQETNLGKEENHAQTSNPPKNGVVRHESKKTLSFSDSSVEKKINNHFASPAQLGLG